MKSITKRLLESLNEGASGNTIKDYAINYLGGYIDNDVTDVEIDMLVAFSFDFNEEPEADFKAYNDFMNLIAERTKIVKVNDSEYGATLVCDFSSVFKPYNEQLKEFFDMDNSEFNEDEAWAEAVDNLEALISGNAGDSSYNELINILNGKQTTNEADNLESTIDEAARYLFDEGDKDYLPDYEEFNDTTMEISKDLFDKAKERALEALTNLAEHQYYDHDGGYGTVLELNDNHTIWELNNENKSDEEWASIVNSKLAQFEADTGVELMLLGRMGRHACVEPTYDNCMNFTYLQETQEKLEQEAIDEFNAEDMNEELKESIYTTDDGTPAELVADNIMHADSDPRFQTKEQFNDEKLCADLADFALETTDEEYWNKYSDEGYYEKNKRDYMKQINDISFVKGVVDLLETRLRNLDGVDEEYDTESLLAEFKEKLKTLEGAVNESK